MPAKEKESQRVRHHHQSTAVVAVIILPLGKFDLISISARSGARFVFTVPTSVSCVGHTRRSCACSAHICTHFSHACSGLGASIYIHERIFSYVTESALSSLNDPTRKKYPIPCTSHVATHTHTHAHISSSCCPRRRQWQRPVHKLKHTGQMRAYGISIKPICWADHKRKMRKV